MAACFAFIFLLLLPFQFSLESIFSLQLPSIRVLAAVLMAIMLIDQGLKRRINLPPILWTSILLSFLVLAVASLLWVEESSFALRKIVYLWNLLPLAFVWWILFQDEEKRKTLLKVLVTGAVLVGIVAIGFFASQFVVGVSATFHFLVERTLPFFLGSHLGKAVAEYPSLLVNIDGETVLRATGFFPDPHVASFFFGMIGFLALGVFLSEQKKIWLWGAAVLFLADILTFSRGGYIGLIVGAVIFTTLSWRWFSAKQKNILWVAAVLTILTLIMFGSGVKQRFLSSFSLADTSSTERIQLWQEAFSQISKEPFFGTGLGNYIVVVRPLSEYWTPYYAHNLYLDIAVELGIFGLLLWLLIFAVPLREAFSQRKKIGFQGTAAASAICLYLTHSFFETAIFSLHITILVIFTLVLLLSSLESCGSIKQK